MKAIKTLVVGMAVLLVAGLGLLGYGLMTTKSTSRPRISGPTSFDPVTVPLPAGARIEQMSIVADRVILRITGGGSDRLVVLDPVSGQVAGTFTFVPEAPSAP